MYFKIFPLLLTLFLSFQVQAQTKRIAHKSHSGSKATFKIALEKKLFDIERSNFGMAPLRTVRTAQLDTLKFISDSIAVMVTSEYCKQVDRFDDTEIRNSEILWRAGTDTVYNHPLFSKQNNLEIIKKTLKEEYNFQNSVDSMVFIGYENKVVKPKKREKRKIKRKAKKKSIQKETTQEESTKNVVPLIIADKTPPTAPPKLQVDSAGLSTWFYIGIIALLSLLIGTVIRQFQRFYELKKTFVKA